MERNPYADHSPQLPGLALAGYQMPVKKKGTERGELLLYFAQKTGKPIGYIAMRVAGLTLQDLYFLDAKCRQEEARGVAWGKVFYGSIKVL